MITRSNFTLKLFFGLAILLCFWGQFDHEAWTPDEPRVIAISNEMAQSGQWVIPTLGEKAFVEKPPLYFIGAALFIDFLPMLEATNAVRLYNGFLALLTLFFTYLLAKELIGRQGALLSVIALGVMEGFVIQTHWSRVDNILLTLLVMSVWAVYQVQVNQFYRYFILTGISLGLLFLAKGPIGIVFFGAIWLPLFIRSAVNRELNLTWLLSFVGAFLIAVAVAGIWVWQLYTQGGEALFNEWFWDNQVGRLTGTSEHLGHIYPGVYHYYLNSIAEYTLPWLPILVAGLFTLKKQLSDGGHVNALLINLGVLICLVVLTISDTKRSLYILPLLPFLAIFVAQTLTIFEDKIENNLFIKGFSILWGTLLLIAVTALVALPFVAPYYKEMIPAHVYGAATTVSLFQVFAIVICLLLAIFAIKRQVRPLNFMLFSTFIFFTLGWSLAAPVVDAAKTLKPETEKLAEFIPVTERNAILGYNFSETSLAALSLYANWTLKNSFSSEENDARIKAILEGRDPVYRSVLVDSAKADKFFADNPRLQHLDIEIKFVARPRSDKINQGFYWISGK